MNPAERIRRAGGTYAANDNISAHLSAGDLDAIETHAAVLIDKLLQVLVIDTEHDHNTEGTAQRVARMLVREVFAGRYLPQPNGTDFPNAKRLDELYAVGPIAVRSSCAHHLVPILGECWIGVIPGERVLGLSKFARIAEWIMARPQIQEEACVQLADALEALIAPRALGVVVKAQHLCMSWRGVRHADAMMTTSVMRGRFLDTPEARAELFTVLHGQGFR